MTRRRTTDHYTTSHDFASSRKPPPVKKKARKPVSAGVPVWVWMVVCVVGGAVLMYASGRMAQSPSTEPAPVEAPAPTTKANKTTTAQEPPAPPKRTSPVFEFYTRLPANGAPTVDTQALQNATTAPGTPSSPAHPSTAPSQSAEPAANDSEAAPDAIEQLMAQREAAAQPSPPPSVQPSAQPSVQQPAPQTMQPPAAEKPAVAEKQAVTEKPAPKKEDKKEDKASPAARYALQTGAFRKRSEADTQRAKILMLGISASVQPASNGMYRVVVGPFRNQSDMDDAKIMLDGNHISNIPVK